MYNLYKYNQVSNCFTIAFKVRASAKEDKIHYFEELDGNCYLKIFIKAVPEGGKANKSIIKYLSKSWKIPQANLEIIQGLNSSNKVLRIKNITEDALKLIFSTYIASK